MHTNNSLGPYRLLAGLGSGGMGDVYLATRDGPGRFNKLVVIKELRPMLAADPAFVDMFLDEARLAARLSHPNLVHTHEISSEGGAYFIAMEYLDGQSLQQVLTRFKQLGGMPRPLGLRILCEALAGLEYAHDLTDYAGDPLDIVHRDISPHNVFVTYAGQVKVVDFGIAKTVDSSSDTKLGTLKGKVGYMAPEQARGEALDRRADIFAAGAILWEILLGKRMWRDHTEAQILTRLAAGDVPSLGKAGPELDPELVVIGGRALGPHRDERYGTAADFQRDLERYLAETSDAYDTRRIGTLVAEAFQEDRARFRELVHQKLADPASVPLALGPYRIPSAPTSSPSTSNPSGFVRLAPSGTPVLTPSPPPVSIQTEPRTVHDNETVVIHPTRQKASGRLVRALAFGALLGVLFVAFYLNESARVNPSRALAESGVAREPAGPVLRAPSPAPAGNCVAPSKQLVEISGDIVADATLRCDASYLLKFTTFVKSGVTLTIEKGTTVYGDTATRGTLVIQPGARLVARGTPDEPIVFTSENEPAGTARAGDWGGVIMLGHAPTNLRGVGGKPARGRIEGITSGGEYGGSNPDDDSGIIDYVRIEWSGTEIAPNNEINGLTLGGVGRKTTLSHVMVRNTADDCYEFFGGTVNANYLVCLRPGDDGFDWDYGYRGKLQFLVSISAHEAPAESNGFEGDNDPNGSNNEPLSEPAIYNATLCGPGRPSGKPSYGMLLRRSTRAIVRNAVVTGFDAGIDVRDRTLPDVRSSSFFANAGADFGAFEVLGTSEGALADDDNAFDEAAFFRDAARDNSNENPGLADCLDLSKSGPRPRSAAPSGTAPPDDGFLDPSATFRGAFRDSADRWGAGRWIVWK